MKAFSFLVVILFSVSIAVAQTTPPAKDFQAAQEAYESGEYQQAITHLDALEKSVGTSPRVESLRALAYRDLNQPREAYKALLVYFKLTAKMDLSDSEAHKNLIDLRDALSAQFEKEFQDKKAELEQKREQRANKATVETTPTKAPEKSSADAEDPLVELEMWNKVKASNTANDYYLFIQRYPDGVFTRMAQQKLEAVGDPIWNEIKKSTDPFVYREFLRKYPKSPFAAQAKVRMNELAAETIRWEQIKDSTDLYTFKRYYQTNSDSPFAAEAKRKAAAIEWERIKGSTQQWELKAYLSEYPDAPNAAEVKAKIELPKSIDAPGGSPAGTMALSKPKTVTIGSSNTMEVYHPHYSKVLKGTLTFEGGILKYVELPNEDKQPNPEHPFESPCSNLKLAEYWSGSYFLFKFNNGRDAIYLQPDDNSDAAKQFLLKIQRECSLKVQETVAAAENVEVMRDADALNVKHDHGGMISFSFVYGKLSFTNGVLAYTEITKAGYGDPKPEHNFSLPCSMIRSIDGGIKAVDGKKYWVWNDDSSARTKAFWSNVRTTCGFPDPEDKQRR